jgi:hypothetical protein
MPMPKPTLATSLAQNLRQIRQQLSQLDLNLPARQSGFLRRSPRKIPMFHFLLGLLALAAECCLSLERAAAVIGLAAQTAYTKQALSKRLNDHLERFLAQVALLLFGQQSQSPELRGWLQPFGRVLLHDSTTQALPAHLAEDFPGSSNQRDKQQAAVKVQLMGDLRTGTLFHLSLSGFRRNDQAAAPDILEVVQRGDLIIRDLGYWALHVFEAILLKCAHFLSRYRHGTTVYDPATGRALNLSALLRRHGSLDQQVLLGSEHKLSVRLVAVPVPEAVANERRRRARANRDRRLNPSPERLFLLGWNIFVTSVDRQTWPPKAIQPIYRLRWRIEIVFKAWKSHLGFRELNCRSARLLRLSLMTKLLFCVLVYQACNHLELIGSQARHVSLLRLARICAECSALIAAAILELSPQEWLAHQLDSHVFYEERKDRKNFFEMLAELARPLG